MGRAPWILGLTALGVGAAVLLTKSGSGYRPPPGAKQRIVRFRGLSDNGNTGIWSPPINAVTGFPYTTTDFINFIKDLQPDTLNRYFSGPQDPNQLIPSATGFMTSLEYVQQSINACRSQSSKTMFPRLSLSQYWTSADPNGTLFFQYAQNMFNFCQLLSPRQTVLSLDDWGGWIATFGVAVADSVLIPTLLAQGWTAIMIGAEGAPEITGPSGNALSLSMWGVDAMTWQPLWSQLQALMQSQPNDKDYQLIIDFPRKMRVFANLLPDSQAQVMASLVEQQPAANNQVGITYRYVYPIIQGFYDSTQIRTTIAGPYWNANDTMYTVMRNLSRAFDV